MGDITILVNNAAVVHGKSLMDSDDDALLKSQHINTLGQFWVRAAPPPGSLGMERGGGGSPGLGLPPGAMVQDKVAGKRNVAAPH